MNYPKEPMEFIKGYSFVDSDEVYTNGAELVPLFRVEQMLEHYLKPIKDKQEQGLLIELPCKVGDTVFLLMNGNTKIVECTVLWIEWHRNGTVVFSLDGGTGDVVMAHLGKKWFLTRSEAEEALAKKGE
jgi:hypothetical protein